MKISGIIVEYNPLHNGHLYHLNEVKRISESDCIIAVMSGNFTQRGEPAIINKTIRTFLALKAGVDIVVELPYIYAVGHSDLFSFGAISILNHLGVNEIIFGSEENNLSLLKEISQIIDTPLFNDLLKDYLDKGFSYPESASLSINDTLKKDIRLLPNDLLALQYTRQANKINKNINVKSIKRIHNNYHDKDINLEGITSATSIRNALINKQDISNTVPSYTLKALNNTTLHYWENYYPYLKYKIISMKDALENIHDVNEGFQNAIINNINQCNDFTQLVTNLTSKRYTKGKVQRILTHILNHITKDEVSKHQIHNGPQYIRILGFKKEKSHIIKQLKENSLLPVITNINKSNYHYVKLELKVSSVYHIIDNDKERKIPVII